MAMKYNKELRKLVCDLALKTDKPILKLTQKDYIDNGLQPLLDKYGTYYEINVKVFDELQHTITGWPAGKPNADDTHRPERAFPFPKTVLVFSPHPDDDVISMGGTIQRIVSHGHIVHVAYHTSGNIAVTNEEVMRYMHFMNGFQKIFCKQPDDTIKEKYNEIKELTRKNNADDYNTRDMLTLKALIRRGEARMACAYNDIPKEQIHFLDMPFYESGKIEKLPLGPEDYKRVKDIITEIKPHMIFVAGDLADPHGTHRKCTEAVFDVMNELRKENPEWLKNCRVWMYRGAWAEYSIEEIEMAVPMSPDELRNKRNSTLRHQSQMECAPFLGNDERLFWQRSEDRNRATAALYDKLGLTCYEAMEAFVEWHF